jgi:ribosome biogenesis protein BMS1
MLDCFKKNLKSNKNNSLPIIISIIGPRKVGKTTFNKSIASYFLCNFNEYLYGPLVILIEQNISYLFIESPPDILSISNLTKASDIIVLAIDGYFGLELEIFEFSSFLNSHGSPRVLAVFTHIDLFSNWKNLKKAKKRSKIR